MRRCLIVFAVSFYTLVPFGTAQNPDTLESTDKSPFSFFGSSVALSGERALVGGYIFEPSDGSWKQAAEIDHSIFAEALDNERALVGHPSQNEVSVFERQPDGSWPLVATIAPEDPTEGANFGAFVSLDGNRAVVGAPATVETPDNGSAYIFERQSTEFWQQLAKLTPSDAPANSGLFGFRVALQDNRALIGWGNRELPEEPGYLASGVPHLFEQQPDGSWTLVSKLVVPGVSEDNQIGAEVAIDGDIALARIYPARLGANAGAYVFERQLNGTWQFAQVLSSPSQGVHSVDVDESYAIFGATDAQPQGEASVFHRQTDGSWALLTTLSREGASSRYGYAVDLDGDAALVGEWTEFGPGAAYLYRNIVPTRADRKLIGPSFLLSQNYPNPFKSSTKISFVLNRPSSVKLSVYDLLGREVALLIDDTRQPGPHEVVFDPSSNLPSGLYHFELVVAEFKEIRQMVFIR